jgi:hypothetical protein
MNGCRTDMKLGQTAGHEQSALRLSVPFSGQSIPLSRIFRALVIEEFDRVAVEHTDHLTRELASHGGPGKPENEESHEETAYEQACHTMARGGDHDRGSVTRGECDSRHRAA